MIIKGQADRNKDRSICKTDAGLSYSGIIVLRLGFLSARTCFILVSFCSMYYPGKLNCMSDHLKNLDCHNNRSSLAFYSKIVTTFMISLACSRYRNTLFLNDGPSIIGVAVTTFKDTVHPEHHACVHCTVHLTCCLWN